MNLRRRSWFLKNSLRAAVCFLSPQVITAAVLEPYYRAPDPKVSFEARYPEQDNFPKFPWVFAGRKLSQQATLAPLLADISTEKLRESVADLVKFNNRYYRSSTGRASLIAYADKFKAIAKDRADIEIILQEHATADAPRVQPSLIVRIKGREALASEHIIVGTPADCINSVTGMANVNDPCPGADDNASGMAVILEAFRILVEKDIRPLRTLEFIAYAGEELGLIGSHYVSESYRLQGTDVKAVLQLEGTMYPGTEPKIALVSDFTHPEVSAFLGQIVTAYLDVPFVMSACGYGCSDHAAWRQRGFPVGFPYSETIGKDNPHAHTPQDTIDRVSFEHGKRFTRLTLAFLVELAMHR
jgi:bacterial leucyl aminopeptidase